MKFVFLLTAALVAPSLDVRLAVAQPPAGPDAQLPGAPGDTAAQAPGANLQWRIGPVKGELGSQATIEVPEGFRFLDAANTRLFMQETGNLISNNELGTLAPNDESIPWFVVFEFDNSGYVKDDDKDSLDADALLEAMQEGGKHSNAEREKRNLPILNLVGWEIPPAYNTETNNLEWALRIESVPGGMGVNYQSRILGRQGVMEVVLVVDPDQLQATLPTFRNLLSGFHYNPGKTYAEFRSGDRIAEYGLTALVAGGGLAVAAKTGLLAKLGAMLAKSAKAIILVLVAIGAGIAKLFGFKKRKTSG